MLPEVFTPRFLHQLELLKLHSRRAFLGSRQGGHASLKRGHGIEFADYRKYEPGDNPRHIDWGVYGRSERLYVKRFQEEQALSVLVMLDTSASMFTPRQEGKWERARDIAIALSFIALMEQNGVSIAPLGARAVPKFYGASAVHRVSSYLSEVSPSETADPARSLSYALGQVRFPGVAVLISDLLFPLTELGTMLRALVAKNLDTTIIQVLGPSDLDPASLGASLTAVDSETGEEMPLELNPQVTTEYQYLLDRHNAQVKRMTSEHRIRHVIAPVTTDLHQLMLRNLPKTGLLS